MNVNYSSDFSTLGQEGAPADAAIVYQASVVGSEDAAAWQNLDSRDLMARTMAQEAPHENNTTIEQLHVEMTAVGQNVYCRSREGFGDTLNGILWDGYALGFDSDARGLYANPLDDPVERSRYEIGLAVAIGVENEWLYDPRTFNKNSMHGYGQYNRYYRMGEELPEQGNKVTSYPVGGYD